MPFRASFDCLWCGTAHTTRSPDDLEGWAQLCPSCIGRADENGFIRFRVRDALAERGAARAATRSEVQATSAANARGEDGWPDPGREMIEYYEAHTPEYDDWYLRRGRYSHGPIHDAAWHAELDAAGRWLDELPMRGEIVELAAGTGWWSPLLAGKGELALYDATWAPLERARDRLLAHGLRAHLHVRDAWDEPDRRVDALFAGFWMSHVPRARLDEFVSLARRWLKPDGTFAFIDSLPDEASEATGDEAAPGGVSIRRLADGREFHVVKVHYEADELRDALGRAGFAEGELRTTGRFFLLGSARAGGGDGEGR